MTRAVVIGAGIVGAALAVRLVEAGDDVALVDAGAPGGGTSRTSLAWLNANQKRPRAYFDLNVEGMRAWRRLAAEFDARPWYVPTGNLIWAEADGARDELSARVARLRDWGYAAEFLTHQQVGDLEPGLRLPAGAEVVRFPEEGFVHAGRAVESLVTRAAHAGAAVVTGDPVTGFVTKGGRVTAARVASGGAVTGDVFVLCAGRWTADLAAGLGVTVPLVPPEAPGSHAPSLVALTTPIASRLGRLVHAPHVHARPAEDGGVLLVAGEVGALAVDVTTPAADLDRAAAELLRRGAQILPALDGARVREASLCIRPLPVDGYPIVGWCREVGGCYVVVTHSGITLAPRLAELAASEIMERKRADALDPYRPDRFDRFDRS
ncbi:MAG: NAD(P)/FAD-dependent oxidoreductase [Egibacteraceae bacterium]